eukprot:6376335-Pyramimonas_sp.AAC.1
MRQRQIVVFEESLPTPPRTVKHCPRRIPPEPTPWRGAFELQKGHVIPPGPSGVGTPNVCPRRHVTPSIFLGQTIQNFGELGKLQTVQRVILTVERGRLPLHLDLMQPRPAPATSHSHAADRNAPRDTGRGNGGRGRG